MRIYTKRGDDGTTGLLYGGRVPKSDLRVEAYGSADEAVAVLGIARAACADIPVREIILRLQRELFVVGAELATDPKKADKLKPQETKVTAEMVGSLERLIDELETRIRMPKEFVIPGESPVSAALELARAVVRRCERRTVALELPAGSECVRYLNRLADLLWILARFEEGGFTPLHER